MQLQIVSKMLSELGKRLEGQYYSVSFTDRLRQHIIDAAYSPEYGARPLKRFIQDEVETELATAIIEGRLSTKRSYLVDYDGSRITIAEKA